MNKKQILEEFDEKFPKETTSDMSVYQESESQDGKGCDIHKELKQFISDSLDSYVEGVITEKNIRIQIGEVAGTIGGIALYLENHNLTCGKSHAKLLRDMEKKLEDISYQIDADQIKQGK